jgi:hypothetical protein
MGTWLRWWPTDTHLPAPVGQAEVSCCGQVWANHHGAPTCKLKRWSVGTSKLRRVGSRLHKAQRIQEACGCVRKAEDHGSRWSLESWRIQPLRGVLALYQSSMQDQASREPRHQEWHEALVPLRRWEEEHHRISSSKMICMPTHMCNNVFNYQLMRTICVTTYYCNGTIHIYYYRTPSTTTTITLATYVWNKCKTCCNIHLQLLLLHTLVPLHTLLPLLR